MSEEQNCPKIQKMSQLSLQAIQARHDAAYQMLENGFPLSTVASFIQTKFGIGRSSAYATAQKAQMQREEHQRYSPDFEDSVHNDVTTEEFLPILRYCREPG